MMKNTLTELKQYHSDIIFTAPNRIPKQDVIYLEKYLNRIHPDKDLFIQNIDLNDIRNSLKNKYGNDTICFKDYGELLDVRLDNLRYYQPDVGINGPFNNSVLDPVYVINVLGINILFNGYHRTFYFMTQGSQTIKAYCLTI